MKEDVGMSKPQKYANKVGIVITQEVNVGPKTKQTISLYKYSSFANLFYCRVIWK